MASYPIRSDERAEMRAANHKTLGVLWIVYGLLCIVGAAWLAVYHPTLRVMWGTLISRVADPFTWMGVFHILLLIAVCLSAITAVLSILAGAALMGRSRSRSNITIAASIFAILTGPLGTALAVLTLMVASRPVWQMYDRMSTAA
jgi:hypothetical protein